jgi:hypothetical protein
MLELLPASWELSLFLPFLCLNLRFTYYCCKPNITLKNNLIDALMGKIHVVYLLLHLLFLSESFVGEKHFNNFHTIQLWHVLYYYDLDSIKVQEEILSTPQ